MLFQDRAMGGSRRWALGLTALCSLLLIVAATTAAANWPAVVPAGTGMASHEHGENCDPRDCDPIPETKIAAELPDLEFRSPSAGSVWLSNLEGSVVVVEFWAAWCKYCQNDVTQMKALNDLLAQAVDGRVRWSS